MTTIRACLHVALPPARAFARFARDMTLWWPPAGRAPDAPQVILEPRVGGRWYERDAHRRESSWGRVLVWQPPHELVLSWQVGANGDFDPDLATELALRFVEQPAGQTRVELEHRHLERYGDAAPAQVDALGSAVGWLGILDRFAQFCGGTPGSTGAMSSSADGTNHA